MAPAAPALVDLAFHCPQGDVTGLRPPLFWCCWPSPAATFHSQARMARPDRLSSRSPSNESRAVQGTAVSMQRQAAKPLVSAARTAHHQKCHWARRRTERREVHGLGGRCRGRSVDRITRAAALGTASWASWDRRANSTAEEDGGVGAGVGFPRDGSEVAPRLAPTFDPAAEAVAATMPSR